MDNTQTLANWAMVIAEYVVPYERPISKRPMLEITIGHRVYSFARDIENDNRLLEAFRQIYLEAEKESED